MIECSLQTKWLWVRVQLQSNKQVYFLTLFTYVFGIIVKIRWGYGFVSFYSKNLELR